MNRQRKPYESYARYKTALRVEEHEAKIKRKGRMIWRSSELGTYKRMKNN